MPGGFDPVGPAADPEGREQLADGPAAGLAADFALPAYADEDLKFLLTRFTAEFIKWHGTLIVEDFDSPGKSG